MILSAKFEAGQTVYIGRGEISGIIDRVIFSRGCAKPLYHVEWWRDGDLCTREFHEDDVSATP
jgi:hypothetical protein